MKHLIKVFAVVMFFSSTMAVAQSTDKVEEKAEKKVEKVVVVDEDKRVYKSEKKGMTPAMKAEKKIAGMDGNKDGKISVDEASNSENKWYSENFAKVDTNNDGFIDLTELTTKIEMKKKNKEKSKDKLDY